LWVSSAFLIIDVIFPLQKGNLAVVVKGQNARRVSSEKRSASIRPHLDEEVLVKLRGGVGNSRKFARWMHARSVRRPKKGCPPFPTFPLTCLSLQYRRPVRTASDYHQPTVRRVRTPSGRRVASTGPFSLHSLRLRQGWDCHVNARPDIHWIIYTPDTVLWEAKARLGTLPVKAEARQSSGSRHVG
jgi:hypothetical protein